MKEDSDSNGIENKAYTFSEIPLEPPISNTQISFNEAKNEIDVETNSRNGTGVQKMSNQVKLCL